jgi:hypothetical protein
MRRRWIGLVWIAGLTGALLGAPAAQASDGGGGCDVVSQNWTASAAVDEARTKRFADYGNTGVGWTGGDSTYSVKLDHGRTVWLFSDTFWGPVNADGSRPTDVPFLNNSFVVERNGKLTTVPKEPRSLVEPDEPNTWNWLGAGFKNGRTLDIVFLEYGKTGPSPWDFVWRENKLVRFDAATLERLSITKLPSSANIQWASWIERKGAHTYVYGVEDLGANKYMHLARVKGTDLAKPWQYWTGTTWTANEQDSARIMPGVANEYSVTRFHDGYLLVTQDTTEIFSRNIVAYTACELTGPFTRKATLYQTPETGAFGSYGNPNIITYNAHEHPDLRRGDELLVTYNVNSLDPNADLYRDVTIYRPRFVKVKLTPTP